MSMPPSSPDTCLQVISFPGGFNLPIWIAQDLGYFANCGVQVELTPTRSSVEQMGGLATGKYHIAMTAFDNVLAYRDGHGESELVDGETDIMAFMGGDDGFLSLVATPEIKTVQDLRGRALGVDAMTTGYAFVLMEMLSKAGLHEGDYSVVRAGGVAQRYEKLLQGEFEATLLVTPLDVSAAAQGLQVLGRAASVFGNYQGVVGAASSAWLDDNKEAASGYIQGYIRALDWLGDEANRDAALDCFMRRMPDMPRERAQAAVNALLAKPQGMQEKARLDSAGALQVLKLRAKHAPTPPLSQDLSRYVKSELYASTVR